MHDNDLPAALAVDVDGSFERLVITFQQPLYAFALRFTAQPQDAEEIVADALVRAYQALSKYPPERIRTLGLRPWLYRITLNVCRNRHRRKRLPVMSLQGQANEGMGEVADSASKRPDVMLERQEHQALLAACLATLPASERTAVILRHVQGLGYHDIARLLEQPIGTVKSHVHRGLQRLRAALSATDIGR